jgi:transcriptional regulator with XRE-family HTH domain
MEFDELYHNEGYWTSKLQVELYQELEQYMKRNRLTRTQLAKHLGVSKGYVSQILNGDFDHRISKLVKIALAIGLIPDLQYKDLAEYIQNSKMDIRTYTWEVTVPIGETLIEPLEDSPETAVKTREHQPTLENAG